MRGRSLAREFSGTVKEILGTCVSIGCTVEGKDPREIQKEITTGQRIIPPYEAPEEDEEEKKE